MILDLAIGKSRKTKTWANKKMAWTDLVQKLSQTHRTAETLSQYINSSKERQSEIKDIGGFVGGYLIDGKRTPVTKVKFRQLITLDIDEIKETDDVWFDFTTLFDCEAVIYSTHKHRTDAPRLRLMIPLDRPVNIDEYEAIARKIADKIGMRLFDSTTFQPQRLMYWPSTSIDGDYFYEYQQSGTFLCANDILKEYHNWRDISEWPMTDNEDISVKHDYKIQGKPQDKPGLIGAFNRAYSIYDAVAEFLPKHYDDAGEGRLTYQGGSTFGGVVVYGDGDFAYSHHNTDPAHGRLLNAFDLVRIHLFGDMDKDSDAAINKLPSFKEMSAFASTNVNVIREIGVFDEPIQDISLDLDEDWMSKLKVNDKGNYRPTIENLVLIIGNDEELHNRIRYNRFENNIFIVKDVPWGKIPSPRPFVDADDASLRHYIERVYGIFNVGKAFDALNIVAVRKSYHPIQDYISTLSWDGVKRIDTLLIDHMGAVDSTYVRTVTRKALVAAVARIHKPGIKFDYVLTLVGPQGIQKSTFIGKLGMQWFSDSFTTVHGKESYEQLQGAWLIEIAELSGLKKADVETVKHFISKPSDRFRVAYGRRNENFPRQCVFFGTTNEMTFLKDYTGNRRFWPVQVKGGDISKINVDQVWAEAMYLFCDGEELYIEDQLIDAEAKKVQSNHSEVDERIGVVEAFLNILLPKDWDKHSVEQRRSYLRSPEEDHERFGIKTREYVCVAEIWTEVFKKDYGDMNTANTKYIHQIISAIGGWEKGENLKSFGPYGRQRYYKKTEDIFELI